MRIRFLTAGAEPGKDGIGDYTYRLALECEKRGHETEMVAFNDSRTDKILSSNRLLRLPNALNWEQRWEAFEHWSQDRDRSDWASLQFVPYGFQKKGFVRGWSGRIRTLVRGSRLQVMFHETWIGQGTDAPFKHRCVGALQRVFVKSMMRTLRPAVIHTTNDFYGAVLNQAGFPAEVLPLFGNIAFHPDPAPTQTESELQKALGFPSRQGVWIFGIFGTLHPVWPPEPLMTTLIETGARHQKEIGIVSIGRIGDGQSLWNDLVKKNVGRVRFAQLGERSTSEVSHVFQALDYGISATPFEILGKSGSAAAMRDHGLPMIVNRFQTSEPKVLPDGIFSPRTFAAAAGSIKRDSLRDASSVVEKFLAALNAAK